MIKIIEYAYNSVASNGKWNTKNSLLNEVDEKSSLLMFYGCYYDDSLCSAFLDKHSFDM